MEDKAAARGYEIKIWSKGRAAFRITWKAVAAEQEALRGAI